MGESGGHYFRNEDGVWVCQICGEVNQMKNPPHPVMPKVRAEVLTAWNAYLQEGWLQDGHLRTVRNDRFQLIELVYGAFCTAWVKGRDDLVPSVNAIATRAAAAGRAEERERIRQALTERQAVLAYVATSRQVVAVLMKDIEDVLERGTE